MNSHVPSTKEVMELLAPLDHGALRQRAMFSGVSFTVIYQIKTDRSRNPRLETVHKLWPHLLAASRAGVASSDSLPAPAVKRQAP